MGVGNFLRPTKLKIVAFAVILLLGFVFYYLAASSCPMDSARDCGKLQAIALIVIGPLVAVVLLVSKLSDLFMLGVALGIIINLFYLYIIAVVVMKLIERIYKKG